ncbi:hypothetical protein SS17_2954 [Escherichia coli O157:H7 str. SS17]|nr:hypothetical protein SS17_2954 [Escherichia coli O157:H7 str. SS17]
MATEEAVFAIMAPATRFSVVAEARGTARRSIASRFFMACARPFIAILIPVRQKSGVYRCTCHNGSPSVCAPQTQQHHDGPDGTGLKTPPVTTGCPKAPPSPRTLPPASRRTRRR